MKFVFLAIAILGSVILVQAQQCEGNLGENIFLEGDFGSGTANIPDTDPQIAPGYTYVRTGPPQDGSYLLTNNTGVWQGLFPGWLEIQDNSPDPNGYMMVVNASLEPGLFYEETIDNLCENTLYEFSVDVINLIAPGSDNLILPVVDFLLDDVVVFSSGEINQSGVWTTYGFTFRTEPNATELKLSLRNNAPGGIGNDLALDNISFRACGPNAFIGVNTDQTIFLCEEDNDPLTITADLGNSGFQVFWQTSTDDGITWTDLSEQTRVELVHTNFQPGRYRYRYVAAPNAMNLENFKCRTVSDEIAIEVLTPEYEFTDSICAGVPYPFAGGSITTPGIHEATLLSSRNCDSIVTLNLHHVADANLQINFETSNPVCFGDTSGILEIMDANGGTEPYAFLLDDEAILQGVQTRLADGVYQLQVEDRFGCRDSVDFNLAGPVAFEIDAGRDTNLILGESYTVEIFSSENLELINWSPPDFLSCSDCATATATGIETTTYLITAENNSGCTALDTLNIFVQRESLPLYIPNAFTPDQNGVNDIFSLISPSQAVAQIETLQIFNRWGVLVFEGKNLNPNDPQSGWDGTIGGTSANPGVYVYSASLRLRDNSVEKRSGTVTLIK